MDGVLGGHLPAAGTGGEHFDKRKTTAIDLILQRLANRFSGPHMLFGIRQSDAFNVGRAIKSGQQLTHAHRRPFHPKGAASGRSGGSLTERSGRSHLPAGHAINTVIHEKDRDCFSAICSVQYFIPADGRQIAIPLVTEYDGIRAHTFNACRHCGSTAVRGGDIAHIHVVVHKYGAAYRTDKDSPVLNAEIVNGFSNHLMQHAMTASGTVMGYLGIPAFAFVAIIKRCRLAMRNFPHSLSPFF